MSCKVRYAGIMPRVNGGGVHQQDFVWDARGISGSVVVGTHGNTAHYTKTMILYERN